MNNFIIDTPDNFWQIRWLDKYMEGHKGFIAGGCFKNILSGEKVKDIDIFFESEDDFQEAVDLFNDEKHQKEGWKFKYRNEKVCAFQKEGEKVWVEFIESEFGKPEEILRSFDFTVAKMAYYKEPKYEEEEYEEEEDDYFPFSSASIVAYEYKLLYHEKFFEHLHMKRLVIDENIPFPVFMLKDIGIGFRTIEGATEVANSLIKYNAFKMESKFLIGSYEQFRIIGESVCPAIKEEAGYSKEEFDKVNKENEDPELKSIKSFNDTVKKANEIKVRVLKYVYNIKQERSYNNDLVGIFERYKDIADGDLEVAMKFIKEAYPFNEETESFIRKKFDMPIPEESKEQ